MCWEDEQQMFAGHQVSTRQVDSTHRSSLAEAHRRVVGRYVHRQEETNTTGYQPSWKTVILITSIQLAGNKDDSHPKVCKEFLNKGFSIKQPLSSEPVKLFHQLRPISVAVAPRLTRSRSGHRSSTGTHSRPFQLSERQLSYRLPR